MKHPLLYGVIILIVIIFIIILVLNTRKAPLQTMVVTRGEFLSEVSASGKVVAAQSSDLGFDQSGRVSSIYAKVGDTVKSGSILASIENGSTRADIAQKQAVLEREKAKLAALRRGTRQEQLTLTEQKYIDASSALIIAIKDAYLKTENALLGGADTIFINGNSVNPTITIYTQSDNEKRSIQDERITVSEKLLEWNNRLSTLQSSTTQSTLTSIRSVGTDALLFTRSFLDHLGGITSRLNNGNSGLNQSTIDSIRTTINNAGQAVSMAASTEQSAYAAWTIALNDLNLEKSGSTAEDISAQEAQVKASEADLISAQAQLRKTLIIAPFDGIVTKMDAKIGEISSPSISQVSMIGTGKFEIESYIPEVSISRLSVGNQAVITLDAYGSDLEFSASVIAIDPAETTRDGVSTYKTTLLFADEDQRIKPGMTANIRITSERKSGVIVIPKSIISDSDGMKTVNIKSKDDAVRKVSIETGSMTALGQVEVTSGLSEGDILVIPKITK